MYTFFSFPIIFIRDVRRFPFVRLSILLKFDIISKIIIPKRNGGAHGNEKTRFPPAAAGCDLVLRGTSGVYGRGCGARPVLSGRSGAARDRWGLPHQPCALRPPQAGACGLCAERDGFRRRFGACGLAVPDGGAPPAGGGDHLGKSRVLCDHGSGGRHALSDDGQRHPGLHDRLAARRAK